MNAQAALKNYSGIKVNAAVESATPQQLIQMLYDGLLERIAQMKGAIVHKNIELKNQKVNQAISILFCLRDSLNKDINEELSFKLDGLYDYIQRQLWKAHIKNDTDILDECTNLTNEICSAWRDMEVNI